MTPEQVNEMMTKIRIKSVDELNSELFKNKGGAHD